MRQLVQNTALPGNDLVPSNSVRSKSPVPEFGRSTVLPENKLVPSKSVQSNRGRHRSPVPKLGRSMVLTENKLVPSKLVRSNWGLHMSPGRELGRSSWERNSSGQSWWVLRSYRKPQDVERLERSLLRNNLVLRWLLNWCNLVKSR